MPAFLPSGRGGTVRDFTRSTLVLFLVGALLTACESSEKAKRRHFEKAKALGVRTLAWEEMEKLLEEGSGDVGPRAEDG